MAQTSFTAGDGTTLATVLLDIGSGADAAANTAYSIALTQALSAASETVSLQSGSSVTLSGSTPFIVNAFTVTGSIITNLNFTGTITLHNGAFNNVSLTATAGTIVAGLYTGAVLGTLGDTGDTAVNSGTINYGGPFAAIELATGTVMNGWNGPATALVSGAAGSVLLQSGGLVQNGGSIVSSGSTTAAVFLASGTVDNGQIGDLGAMISGGANGVEITGAGTVVNAGTIAGVASDAVYAGSGTVTNGQIGDTAALIAGGPADNGIWIGTGLGTVSNFGTVSGGGASGVFLAAGGTLSNGASNDGVARIVGAFDGVLLGGPGSVVNFATIQANGSDAVQKVIGVFLENGGSIGNLSSVAVIGGLEWGAIVEGAAGTVTNLGLITASATAGLGLDLTAGGSLVNGTGGTIAGVFDGVRVSAGATGAGASVQNSGTISGTVGVDFATGPTAAAGTLINNGLIKSNTGTSGFAVQFGTGNETLVLGASGSFIGHVLGVNGAGNSTTMELTGGTQGTLSGPGNDGGTVTDSAGSFIFGAIGTVVLDAGASWSAVAPGSLDTVVNAGSLSFATGLITVTGSLGNSGGLSVSGGTLTAATGVLSDSGAIAVGPEGTLSAIGGGISAAGTADIQVGGTAATLNVSGGGATVNGGGKPITIGSSGLASALVSQGGTMLAGTPFVADEALVAGGGAGATGALTVTDPGSRVNATGQLSVGLGGTGSLLIENQATVISGGNTVDAAEGFDAGQLAGASGQVTVTGSNSLLSNTGRFVVGDAGLGSLAVNAGGTVVTTPGTASVAGLAIANTASADGSSVSVTGSGSRLNVTGPLEVGVGGSGVLQVSGGASVIAGSLDGAIVSAAVANISVAGAGSSFVVSGDATVADDGTGVLSVLSGATFSAADLTIGNTSNGSGALVVSGDNSVVNVSGNLNIGTSDGTGDITVGPGGAVHASVVNQQGQVVLEGGLLDPTVNVINQGQTAGGFGTLAAGFIIDEGLIQAGGSKPAQKLLLVQGTVVGGGTLFKNGAAQPSATGVIQINAGGTVELTGAVVNAPTTTFTDNLTPTGTYSVTNSVIDVSFADAAGVLLLDDIARFGGTIASFQTGDRFVITGGTLSGLGVSNGNTLTFSDSGTGAATGGTDKIIFGSAVNSGQFNIVNGNTVQAVPCFAAGTRIETASGAVAVEDLTVGDQVRNHRGEAKQIVWVGLRGVDCVRHPEPETVWPIRVSAGAFGENVPGRDLYLSPDHAVFVNRVLVPVKLLVNGATILQVRPAAVTYYHVELPEHDVILAEGLTVESYLDLDDRTNFQRHGEAVRLFPDFGSRLARDTASVWESHAAAPLVLAGPELAAARRVVSVKTPCRAARVGTRYSRTG